MEITKELLEKIWYAQNSMGYKEFYDCFHTEEEKYHSEYGISIHLWKKFVGTKHNLLLFSRMLDLNNMDKLVSYLNSPEFIESYNKEMCVKNG